MQTNVIALLTALGAAGCVAAQSFDVILIDFGSLNAPDRQIFDVSGTQDLFNFSIVDDGSMGEISGSPGGVWWTLKLEEADGGDLYVGGSGTTGRTVLEEGTFSIDPASLDPSIPSCGGSLPVNSIIFSEKMPINDSGTFALAIQFFADCITGANPPFSSERRGDRIITGDAGAIGDTTVDLLAGEGQDLKDFLPSGGFDPDVKLGAANFFVIDSDFLGVPTSPTVCGPATEGVERETISYFSQFKVFGIDNNGHLLLETGVNGPGVINEGGETDADGNYYKQDPRIDPSADCRLRNPALGLSNQKLLIQGFGGPDAVLRSQRGVTTFAGADFPVDDYEVRPFGAWQDAKGTSYSGEADLMVNQFNFTESTVVKDGVELIGTNDTLLAPADPMNTDLDTVDEIITSFTTPLGVNYATVRRNLEFTFFVFVPEFNFYEPAFVSDESDTLATKQVPGYGVLLKDGVPVVREGDPIVPGSTLTWDDPDVTYDASGGETAFQENQTGNLITVVDRDGNTIDTFLSSTNEGEVSIGAVVGNMRGDVIYYGDVDDQDDNTRGTFAAVLNEQRIVLRDGTPIMVDAEPPFGTPEQYYLGKDIIKDLAGQDVDMFLSNDGYFYFLATLVDVPQLPLDFTDARNAIVGEAFVRVKVFEVLDIDRDGLITPAADFAALVANVNNRVLGAGDYDLSCVIDWFDVAAAAEDFESDTP